MTPPPALGENDDPVDKVAAGFVLRRATADGDRWLLIRCVKWGEWGFPKGHADPGETSYATALRECAEETGIALLAVEGAPRALCYHLANGKRKRVIYYPARTDQERVVLSHEHDAWRWVEAEEIPHLLAHKTSRAFFTAWLAEHDRT